MNDRRFHSERRPKFSVIGDQEKMESVAEVIGIRNKPEDYSVLILIEYSMKDLLDYPDSHLIAINRRESSRLLPQTLQLRYHRRSR